MILAATFLACLPLQFDELIDPRVLPLKHTGRVRSVSSATSPAQGALTAMDGTLVLARSSGYSGRLSRIWLSGGHPRATLRATFDGSLIPKLNERIGPGFEEGRGAFLGSFTFHPATAAGARVTYTPLTFRQNFNITITTPADSYEVEWIENETVDPKLLNPEPQPQPVEIPSITVAPGASETLALDDQAGMILQIAFEPDDLAGFDLEKTRLHVTVDDDVAPSIDGAFATIFARPAMKSQFSGGAIEVTEKQMILHLPIPYQKKCKIDIVNGGAKPVSLHASASVLRDPWIPGTRKLHIAEWSGEARAGSPLVVGGVLAAGQYVGLTMKSKVAPAVIQSRLVIEADEMRVYESCNLASAFDGGSDFLKSTYSTRCAGISAASEADWTGFSFRMNRLVAFSKSGRVLIESSSEQSFAASGAAFAYIEAPSIQPESKPADAGAKK